MEKDLSDDQVDDLAKHLSFSSMKDNPSVNNERYASEERQRNNFDNNDDSLRFIRRGEAGAWKKEMNTELAQQFEEWILRNLENTDYEVGVSSR